MVCFQSRFGREEWLQPYLDETLEELPGRGVKRIAVISPAFATTAWRRWRRSRSRTARASGTPAASSSPTFPASTTATPISRLLEELALDEMRGWV